MSDISGKVKHNLLTRAARGGAWVLALKIAVQGAMTLKLLILARLLSPQDFGLMGVVLLTVSMFETFTVTGVDAALVRKKDEIETYLDTAWMIALFRGFTLASILYLGAPIIAGLFNTTGTVLQLRVVAMVFLVRGFTNSATVYFQREMSFEKTFLWGLFEALSDIVVSLLAAWYLRNVWALVMGFLAGASVKVVASFWLYPRWPRFRFRLDKAKELSGFGRWFWGSNILTFLSSETDSLVVGRLLGVTPLGLYQMSNRISTYLTREVSEMISQVAFPMYSRLQDEHERLRKSFLIVTRMSFSVTFPAVLGMILFTPQAIRLILDEKWLSVVPIVRFLMVSGMIRGLGGIGGWLFYGVGKPKLSFLMTGVRLVILVVSLVPLSMQYGLQGAAFAVLLANIGGLFVVLVMMPVVIGIQVIEYFKTIGHSFLIAAVTFLAGYFLYMVTLVDGKPAWLWLFYAGGASLIYLGVLGYLEKDLIVQLKQAFV